MVIRPLDIETLSQQFAAAQPFPHICIDGFLESDFAIEAANSYPTFEDAAKVGRGFSAVNEHLKIQVTEYEHFPDPVKTLADALKSPEFMRQLEQVTGIKNLVWDDTFAGGGMHQTASSGLLDVHVDFNKLADRQMFRRLNLLLYLNPQWEEQWGGLVELWDKDVKVRHHAFMPIINRAVIFATSEFSFHGVTAVKSPESTPRKSFAVYYYTERPPEGYAGFEHTTIFRARPYEYVKKYVRMPAEKLEREVVDRLRRVKRRVKDILPLR